VEKEDMSDSEHVEPENPTATELSNRLFVITMAGVLGFIAVVFAFIIL
jgi:hypothetical protein